MNVRAVDWFYVQNGKQIGPVPVAQFGDLVRSGRITAGTLVWREGLVNWRPLGSIGVTSSSPPLQSASPPLPGAWPLVLTGVQTGCAECGAAFPQSEMIHFAGSWICAKCKPIFFQRVREGAPLAGGGTEAWQSGDAVVTLHGGTLPARCAKCNGPVTGKPLKHTLYWQPTWVYILLLGPLIYIVVSLIVRKRTRVDGAELARGAREPSRLSLRSDAGGESLDARVVIDTSGEAAAAWLGVSVATSTLSVSA